MVSTFACVHLFLLWLCSALDKRLAGNLSLETLWAGFSWWVSHLASAVVPGLLKVCYLFSSVSSFLLKEVRQEVRKDGVFLLEMRSRSLTRLSFLAVLLGASAPLSRSCTYLSFSVVSYCLSLVFPLLCVLWFFSKSRSVHCVHT